MQVTQGGQQNSHPVSRVCGIHVSGTLCPHALLAANDDRRDGRDLPLRRWRLGVHHMLHDTCSQVRQIELTNTHTLCPRPTHPGSIVATRAASHHKTRMHAYTPLHPIPSLHFQYDNQYTGCEARAGDHDRHRRRPIRSAYHKLPRWSTYALTVISTAGWDQRKRESPPGRQERHLVSFSGSQTVQSTPRPCNGIGR